MIPARMRWLRGLWFGPAVWLLLAGVVACRSGPAGPSPAPRGIVLVSVEAARADVLEAYGGELPTPGLNRVAAAGTVFVDAATPTPLARPAAASLLTGLAPDRLGVRDSFADRLDGEIPTLAARMTAAGRRTAAVVASPFCSYSSGLERGFELFDGPETRYGGPAAYYPSVRTAEDVAGRFAQWLSGIGPDETFFAWVHLSDLHGLATLADLPRAREAYAVGVAAVDGGVQAVVSALEGAGLWEETMVVVVGTHGELLGEDDGLGHAFWLRDETLRVPLIVKPHRGAEGFEPGARRADPVWLPDVALSLAAAAGVELETQGDAAPLGSPARERIRLAWTWAPEDQNGWPTRTAVDEGGEWKVYTWDDLERLAAAGADPEGPEAAALARPARPRARRVPDDLRSVLEDELGIESWAEFDAPEPDDAERTRYFRDLALARHALRSRVGGPTRNRSLDLMESGFGGLATRIHRQYVFVLRGRTENATKASNLGLKTYPERPEILHWAAHAALLVDDVDRAALLLEAAASSEGTNWELEYDLACARSRQGDHAGALEHLDRSIRLGYRDWRHIESDSDLDAVRQLPEFATLMREHGR